MSKKYNIELTSILETYKKKLSLYNDNLNDIHNFFKIITTIINYLKFDSNKVDSFFKKSYLSLLLPFENYISFKNGDLQSNSGNCTYTLATITTKEKKDEIIFIKVVQKESQEPNSYSPNDLLLIDIIVSFTFDYIFKNDISFRHYSKYIPSFKYSFPSYSRILYDYSMNWNYNDLIDYNSENSISPYSNKTIENPSETDYEIECFMVVYEAVNKPTTLSLLLYNYLINKTTINKNKLLSYFNKTCDLYDFIKDIGLKYGFMHNDLHLSNILYDQVFDKLLIIDFGRANFAKFILEPNKEINNFTYSEYIKLCYSELLGELQPNDNEILKKLYDNYTYFGTRYSIIGSNNNYFGIIYDLITFIMNLYIYLIAYIYSENNDVYMTFTKHFYKIIAVRFNTVNDIINHNIEINVVSTIDELIEIYCDIRDNYINTPQVECDTKRFYLMLLEGLLYSALYYQHINYNKGWFNISTNNFYIFSHFQILTNLYDLIKFKNFIINDILGNPIYATKLSSDSFFKHFIDKTKINGGYDAYAKMKMKSISKSKPFSLFADYIQEKNKKSSLIETAKAYDNIFNKTYKPLLKKLKRSSPKKLLKKY